MSISISSSTSTNQTTDYYDLEVRLTTLEEQIKITYNTTAPIPASAIGDTLGSVTSEEYLTLRDINTTKTIQQQLNDITETLQADPNDFDDENGVSLAEYNTLNNIDTTQTIQNQFDTINSTIGEIIAANGQALSEIGEAIQLVNDKIDDITNDNAVTKEDFKSLDGVAVSYTSLYTTLNDIYQKITSLQNASTSYIPVGSVFSYIGTSSIPNGYLLCDGSYYTQSTYPALFAVIGTKYKPFAGYSTVNGIPVFYVPDYRGMFLRGSGQSGTFSLIKGPGVGNVQLDSIKEHWHDYYYPQLSKSVLDDVSASGKSRETVWDNSYGPDGNGLVSQTSLDPKDSVETRPINMGVHFIIKA